MGFEAHHSGSNSVSGLGQIIKFLHASMLPIGNGDKNSCALTGMLRIVGCCLSDPRSTACSLVDAASQ